MTDPAPVRWHPVALVAVALAAWVYWPLTQVYFFADDFVHLAELENNGVLRFLLSPFGGHNFLVRNLIFLGTYRVVGLRDDLYFWSILLTHLLNVGLLFGVLRIATRSATLACFGAALWGMSPLAAGTLGWYTAYGHVLTATVLVLVLGPVLRSAATEELPSTRATWWWCALLLAGTTCFGMGIGVALAFPVAFFLLMPDAWRRADVRSAVLALPILTLTLYVGLRVLYTAFEPLSADEAKQQTFLMSGFAAAPALLEHLLGFAVAGTILGFFSTPTDYPGPTTSAAIVTFLAGTVLVAWRGDPLTRRTVLGMLVLCVAAYFVVAVGRSNVFVAYGIEPSRAATTGRYHYLGTIPVVVALCLVLRELGRLALVRAVPRAPALAAGLALLVIGRASAEFVIDDHYPVRTYVLATLAEFAAAAAEEPAGATVYLENRVSPTHLLGAVLPNQLFPGRAGIFLLTHPGDRHDGRRFRFVERDPVTLAKYREQPGTRLAELLIGPEEAPWM
jgi:hypothetical protein